MEKMENGEALCGLKSRFFSIWATRMEKMGDAEIEPLFFK